MTKTRPGGELWKENYGKCASAGAGPLSRLQTNRSGDVSFLSYALEGTRRRLGKSIKMLWLRYREIEKNLFVMMVY